MNHLSRGDKPGKTADTVPTLGDHPKRERPTPKEKRLLPVVERKRLFWLLKTGMRMEGAYLLFGLVMVVRSVPSQALGARDGGEKKHKNLECRARAGRGSGSARIDHARWRGNCAGGQIPRHAKKRREQESGD